MVLNQISASTYGKIGRSSDVSKYVMGGRGQGLEDTNPANELEVEFREEEENKAVSKKWGRGNEDFEVEFSSAAPGPRFSLLLYSIYSSLLSFDFVSD